MRRFFCLLTTIAILASCTEHNTPSDGGGSGGGGTTPPKQQDYEPKAFFEYTLQQPLSVLFTDKSEAEKVKYTFGDGETKTVSDYTQFTHKYSSPGTYEVTARAYNKGGEWADRTQRITIPTPDVYMIGVQYVEAPTDYYYKATCKDDDWITTTWWHTDYTPLLTSDILPYTYTFKAPVLMDGLADDDYYEIFIYQNTKQSGNGTQILRQTILTKTIQKYPEYIELVNNPGTVKIRVLFKYE